MDKHFKILSEIENLSHGYAESNTNVLEPLGTLLDVIVKDTALEQERQKYGEALAVERLLSIIPEFSQTVVKLSTRSNQSPFAPVGAKSDSLCVPLLLLIRTLRNLCAGNKNNQENFRICGGYGVCASTIDRLLCVGAEVMELDRQQQSFFSTSALELRKKSNRSNSGLSLSIEPIMSKDTEVILGRKKANFDQNKGEIELLRALTQCLSNSVIENKLNHQAVWENFFPGTFMRLSTIQSLRVQEPLSFLLYTVCKFNEEHSSQLCTSENGVLILQNLLRAVKAVWDNSKETPGNLATTGNDSLELLISHLFFTGKNLRSAFSKLSFNTLFSEELSTLTRILSISVKTSEVRSVRNSSFSTEFASFLIENVERAAEAVRAISERDPPKCLPTEVPELDVLGYSLAILRNFCLHMQHLRMDESIERSLISLILNLLRSLRPPQSPSADETKGKQDGFYEDNGKFPVDSPYIGYRKDIVSVIANAAFGNKKVQDFVREENGLLPVLQQCTLDKSNPFLREWGIFAMRNLLEGNEANQKEVEDLKLMSGVESPELLAAGMKIEVDEKGNPRLVNIGALEK